MDRNIYSLEREWVHIRGRGTHGQQKHIFPPLLELKRTFTGLSTWYDNKSIYRFSGVQQFIVWAMFTEDRWLSIPAVFIVVWVELKRTEPGQMDWTRSKRKKWSAVTSFWGCVWFSKIRRLASGIFHCRNIFAAIIETLQSPESGVSLSRTCDQWKGWVNESIKRVFGTAWLHLGPGVNTALVVDT